MTAFPSTDAATDLAPLPPGYGRLLERAIAVFEADPHVRALWLSGSLARGDADAHSDLDLLLAIADVEHASFGEQWQFWLGKITPTVLAKRIPFVAGLYAVTPEWLRLDVVWEPERALESTPFRSRRLVFDRGGCDARIPAAIEPGGPSAERVAGLVEECLRILGLLPAVIGREDWLLGVEGVWTQRLLLYQLYQQANAPLPETGLKQWSRKLTARQRERLAALPTGAANREAVVDAQLRVARVLLEDARPLCAKISAAWPDTLEQATRAHLRRELAIEI